MCDINKDKFSQHIFYLLLIVFLQDFLYQKRGKILAEVVAVFFCQIFCERCDGFFGEIDGELFVVEKRCKVVEIARHDSDRNHSQDQKYFHFVFWFCSPENKSSYLHQSKYFKYIKELKPKFICFKTKS